jgi:hypothetical protein
VKLRSICIAGIVAALLLALPSLAPAETLSTAWVELGADGRVVARIVVDTIQACPQIIVDGQRRSMSPRLPVPVGLRPACEAIISTNAKAVSVNGQALALPKRNPSKIVALGDTGCRIKGTQVQACNDPEQWPFARVSSQAATESPDLVIHVGDYLYREVPCPAGSEARCKGTPAGDNWETWNADFFLPAAPLLRAAPWAFARGNHEDCNRSWRGWFYYLDPGNAKPSCDVYSPIYVVRLGSLNLVMMDSSATVEDSADEKQVSQYASQLASLRVSNAWLVDHHPFWGFRPGAADEAPILLSVPLETAWDRKPVKGVSMILSGHVHLFELLSFDHGRPAQLVAGTGGTNLQMSIQKSVNGTLAHGANVVMSGSQSEFGYTLLTKNGKEWKLSLKSRTGKSLFAEDIAKP